MIKHRFKVSFILIVFFGFIFLSTNRNGTDSDLATKLVTELSLEDALLKMGDKKPLHYIEKLDQDSVKIGYELITQGKLADRKHKRLSKFFVCTDCHNLVTEVDDLADESPEARIKYGIENDLPYLPASTFYGMYNKTQWYNGDYQLKYGDLVKPTRDTLANAIQLCAVQCSQGRPLEPWEIRSILHYFKSISIQITDLKMSNRELDELTQYVVNKDKTGLKLLKKKYNAFNPATFGNVTQSSSGADYKGDLKRGEYIFNNGCLHCHEMGKNITNFEFEANGLTLAFFQNQLEKHGHFSVPYLVRKGTYAINGRKQYMPQYTMEKMSETQLVDLLTFISNLEK